MPVNAAPRCGRCGKARTVGRSESAGPKARKKTGRGPTSSDGLPVVLGASRADFAPEAVRRAVIGDAKLKIGVEAAVRQGWDAIIGSDGAFVGMNSFGASAPFKELYKNFSINAEAVADAALRKLGKQ